MKKDKNVQIRVGAIFVALSAGEMKPSLPNKWSLGVVMEKLLELAKKVVDQAEVYSLEETADTVRFENAILKDIESKTQSGISLRVIKDGKLGFAYTKNLLNREELLGNALDSLRGGVEALFDFPETMKRPSCRVV